jgi:hypothetical protein
VEQKDWEDMPAPSAEIRERIMERVSGLFAFLEASKDRRQFDEVERGLVPLLLALGRLFLSYYLARRHEASERELGPWLRRGFRRRKKPERKCLGTFSGRVCFWRTYVRRGRGTGLHPLDLALGLSADGFSLWMSELSARLSTLMPYDQVTGILLYFLGWSPSKTSVEKAVLGFGSHGEAWFASAPPPRGDGEVLVIQVDSKALPTATEEELQKRRGKRSKRRRPLSPRHRGRAKRARRRPKRRRAPGDKAKNGFRTPQRAGRSMSHANVSVPSGTTSSSAESSEGAGPWTGRAAGRHRELGRGETSVRDQPKVRDALEVSSVTGRQAGSVLERPRRDPEIGLRCPLQSGPHAEVRDDARVSFRGLEADATDFEESQENESLLEAFLGHAGSPLEELPRPVGRDRERLASAVADEGDRRVIGLVAVTPQVDQKGGVNADHGAPTSPRNGSRRRP